MQRTRQRGATRFLGGSPFPMKRENRHGADMACAHTGLILEKELAPRPCLPWEICRTLGCGSRRPPLSATDLARTAARTARVVSGGLVVCYGEPH